MILFLSSLPILTISESALAPFSPPRPQNTPPYAPGAPQTRTKGLLSPALRKSPEPHPPPRTAGPPTPIPAPLCPSRTAARARMKMASCPARVTSGSAFTKALTRARGSLERRAPGALVGAGGCGVAASPPVPSSSRAAPLPGAAAAIPARSVLRAAANCVRAGGAGPFPARAGSHTLYGRVTPPLTRPSAAASSRHLSSLTAQVTSSEVWGSLLLCLMTLTRHLASSEKLDCKSKYSSNKNI